jgi:hypothetical protein
MKQAAILLAAGTAAIAAGMAVAGTTTMGSSRDGPVTCEIRAETVRGTTNLTGVVATEAPISGTYKFSIKGRGGSGRTNINQGGAFAAVPGEDFELGKVMLGNPGATYDASLELRVAGKSYGCDARVGSI